MTRSGFYCNFLIKSDKVLNAVICTVNHLVYAINGEGRKHVLLSNGFNYLVSTFTCFKQCIIKLVGWSFDIVGEGKMESQIVIIGTSFVSRKSFICQR